MEVLIDKVAHLSSEFNIWKANNGKERALLLSPIGDTKNQLMFLPTFHLVITIDPMWPSRFNIYLMVFNGKIIRSETVEGDLNIEASALMKELQSSDLRLCSGLQDDSENFTPGAIQENLGDILVKRAKNCKYKSEVKGKCNECHTLNSQPLPLQPTKFITPKVELMEYEENNGDDFNDTKDWNENDFPDSFLDFRNDDAPDEFGAEMKIFAGAKKSKSHKRKSKEKSVKVKTESIEEDSDEEFEDAAAEDPSFNGDEIDEKPKVKSKKSKSPKKYRIDKKKVPFDESSENAKRFSIPDDLLEEGREAKFQCSICFAQIKSDQFMIKHAQTHADAFVDLDSELPCPICGLVVDSKWDMAPHLIRAHSLKGIICYMCGKSDCYKNPPSLIYHIKREHKQEMKVEAIEKSGPRFRGIKVPDDLVRFVIPNALLERPTSKCLTCSLCYGSIKTEEKFRVHIKKHYQHLMKQDLDTEVQCTRCPKVLVDKWELSRHLITEHNYKEKICIFCHQSGFRDAGGLKQHYISFHSHIKVKQDLAQHVCTECGFTSNKYSLKNHMNLMHPDKSKMNSVCYICGWATYNENRLRIHIRRKHPSNIYKCNICQKELTAMNLFVKHYTVHQGTKPFRCGLCSYRSNRDYNILGHIRKSHREVDEQCVKGLVVKDGEFEKLTPEDIARVCTIKKNTGDVKKENSGKGSGFAGKSQKCSFCSYSASQRANVAKHIQNKHKDIIGLGTSPYDFIERTTEDDDYE